MTIPHELETILVSDPETLSGAVRFAGTRIFAFQLFDYILAGRTLEQFLDDFEGVTKEQAQAVMHWKLMEVHRDLESA